MQAREGDAWGREEKSKPKDMWLSESMAFLDEKGLWFLPKPLIPNRTETGLYILSNDY